LLDDLGADSLDTVELVMAYDAAYDEEIPFEESEKGGQLRTKQEVIDYLRKRRKGGEQI
jgi:acyl carrier protein